jgi:hypothetical protein
MGNQHIGQKQQIGVGKESVAGTSVNAAVWLPKLSGDFMPKQKYAYDESGFGNIDQNRNGQNVQNMTEVSFGGNADDTLFGHVLMALFGLEYPCIAIAIPGAVTGTYIEGETITETTSTATGTLRRADVLGSTKILYIDPTGGSGTFAGSKLLTGGTSGATATGGTIIAPSAGRFHLYRRLNTNNPITYSIYGSDPVEDDKALYCALNTLKFSVAAGGWAKYDAVFHGKKMVTASAQTPVYTVTNPLLAKFATLKVASAFSGLDAASAINVESVNLQFTKNLAEFQAFGTTDLTSIHNQMFSVTGDITLLYDAVTYRDYAVNSTKQAMRLTITNTDATTLGNSTFPTLQFDLPSVAFNEFSRTSDNKTLVKQTLKLTAEYDITTALTIQALLANAQITAY